MKICEAHTAHRASYTHLYKQDYLLPCRQRTKINCHQATNGHGANAVEEGVDIWDVVLAVAGVEYPREDEGGESAGSM